MASVAIHHFCTAQRHDGSFCDRPSLSEMPFPICAKHLSEAYAVACEVIGNRPRGGSTPIQSIKPDSVVYYMRIGEYIKIGFTANVATRLRSLPPGTELLAYEQGDRELERRRLADFEACRAVRREWFHPAPELMQHIDALRTAVA